MEQEKGHALDGIEIDAAKYGYSVTRITPVEEINVVCCELVHDATGARHLHIANDDTENTFGVAFKTVPSDSTGVAHILEHTVLCGSAKFPVRDPFFSMLKRSLSTFMNAFTASDWTMYPFSTENRKDFYNLMSVYLDAAFFPNLDELSFMQEGVRLEFEETPGEPENRRLIYKGVVYNEMKGAMSSPDQVMVRSVMSALYPDTTYHFNSGGDPEVIPRLTYRQLKAFHREHYHPCNAFFYTYGNLPLAAHLEKIEKTVLRFFSSPGTPATVATQPRWKLPKRVRKAYPLAKNEDPGKKFQACVAWLAGDITDSFEVLVLNVLSQVLLGNPASPLRKALIESQLGTALSDGTGYDSDNRDTMFACGLKDIREEDAEKVERIVFDTLQSLADSGIDRELVDSAIHQIEFHHKEVTNTPYPYGIKLLVALAGCWLHGGDPIHVLRFEEDMERFRQELATGRFLEERLARYFLENPHRVDFLLVPDTEMADRENRRLTEELAAIAQQLGEADTRKIQSDAAALKSLQEKKEDLSVLPSLELSDIPPSVKSILPANEEELPAICFVQPTAGIFYFSSIAGIQSVPFDLVPLIPFFCHSITRIGTRIRGYEDMSRRINATTGGIGLAASARNRFDDEGSPIPMITFNAKCLERNIEPMFDIIREIARQFSFDDLPRLNNLLMEYRAGLESMIVHNGHRLAISLASRNTSATSQLNEIWSGVHQLQTIKGLTGDASEAALKKLAGRLNALGEIVFSADNLKLSLVGGEDAVETGKTILENSGELREMIVPVSFPDGFGLPEIHLDEFLPREGWSTSASVAFVSSVLPAVRLSHPDAPALAATAKLLRSLYLHREIREKGGAYGGFALYNAESGLFSFGSYRDPHVVSTLSVYERAGEFLRKGTFSDDDIKEAVLQECAEMDKPFPPGQAARKAFYRKIVALSDESREAFKKRLLAITRDDIQRVADTYFHEHAVPAVAVISGEEKLAAANEKMKDAPLAIHRI